MNQSTKQPTEIFAASIATILDAVGEEHDREREIIVRRFGLKERRETLEQIGELLGITRERVRQLEKAIVVRLKLAAEAGELEGLHDAERLIIRDLSENGQALVVFVGLVDGGEAGRNFADEGNVGALLHCGCLDV